MFSPEYVETNFSDQVCKYVYLSFMILLILKFASWKETNKKINWFINFPEDTAILKYPSTGNFPE